MIAWVEEGSELIVATDASERKAATYLLSRSNGRFAGNWTDWLRYDMPLSSGPVEDYTTPLHHCYPPGHQRARLDSLLGITREEASKPEEFRALHGH